MSVARFMIDLYETGSVAVEGPEVAQNVDTRGLEAVLKELEGFARLDVAGAAPAPDLAAAVWAARLMYDCSRLYLFRDLSAEVIVAVTSQPCPSRPGPGTAWSVDLALRFLPELLAMAKRSSSNDPLVEALLGVAHDWPLSAVGVPDAHADIDTFADHPGLLQLYVDRILACGDVSRLGPPCVRRMAAASIGLHTELSPTVAAALSATAA